MSDCIPSASCYVSDQVSLVLVCVYVVLKYLLEYFVVCSRTSPTTLVYSIPKCNPSNVIEFSVVSLHYNKG